MPLVYQCGICRRKFFGFGAWSKMEQHIRKFHRR